jgi:hypothetical protein
VLLLLELDLQRGYALISFVEFAEEGVAKLEEPIDVPFLCGDY